MTTHTATLVTALYDIQREQAGDGRKWDQYLTWFKDTLQIPLPMVIYCESNLEAFIEEHRPSPLREITRIIVQPLQDIPYMSFHDDMKQILTSKEYQKKVKDPQRVECVLPSYNIIQYSKFPWLKHAIAFDPFHSSHFYWIDAGISRFIEGPLSAQRTHAPLKNFVIQGNHMLHTYPMNDLYLWDSQCLLCGTMFGGQKEEVVRMADVIHGYLTQLIKAQWINNEQILLAYLQRLHPEMFEVVLNHTSRHLILFDMLFKHQNM